jgi:hypothetical protein
MAKQATKATARPAQRAAPAQPQRAQPAQSGGSKAQQAARHQGREPEARPTSGRAVPATTERRPVPAQARQQVAKTEDFGNVTNVPAFMREDVGMGKENIGREDIEVPRLKLMQGLSPELNDFNELRPGHFFHTAAEMIFDSAVLVVPVYMDRRYILWRPRDSGGGILARADDGIHWSPASGDFTVQLDKSQGGKTVTWSLAKTVQQSGLANWGTMDPSDPNSPPAATLMYSFVLAFPEHPDLMPAVLTFQRSSIKVGRRFNTKLKTVRTPLFGLQFELTSFEDSNSRGQSFHNISMRGAGLVEDEAAYNSYKNMHLSLKDQGLQIKDIEGLQDEDPEGDADAGEGEEGVDRRF